MIIIYKSYLDRFQCILGTFYIILIILITKYHTYVNKVTSEKESVIYFWYKIISHFQCSNFYLDAVSLSKIGKYLYLYCNSVSTAFVRFAKYI